MKERIGGLILLIGLLVLIGTAGASDLELLTGVQEASQLITGLLISLTGTRIITMGGYKNGN